MVVYRDPIVFREWTTRIDFPMRVAQPLSIMVKNTVILSYSENDKKMASSLRLPLWRGVGGGFLKTLINENAFTLK
jgi:hypothetical protein